MVESRDVAFIDFISQRGILRDYVTIKILTSDFRHYLGDDDSDERWVNTKWIGRALKRLDYVKKKEKNPTKNKTPKK